MTKRTWEVLIFAAVGGAILCAWACIEPSVDKAVPRVLGVQLQLIPQPRRRYDVDVLFVIDNSESMVNQQARLEQQFVAFSNVLDRLGTWGCRRHDLHIGVVSTDLGAGPHTDIPSCELLGGDGGILGRFKGVDRGELCIGPGQRYLVDVAPLGCRIDWDYSGCEHGCTQANCDLFQQENEVLTLVADQDGCPRCRNFTQTLEDTLLCLVDLDRKGCDFEQPLEAMLRALNRNMTPLNRGFLREDAFLEVVIISDEDDCSAADPQVLFDPDPVLNTADSSLGHLSSFRCFEFGVTCDVNGRGPGERGGCVPRPAGDTGALLHPIRRYSGFLEGLKDPMMMVVAAVAGPFDGRVTIEMDRLNRPYVAPSCIHESGGTAVPGVRLKAFTAHFNHPEAMAQWAYGSFCSRDFTAAFEGVSGCISGIMSEPCFVMPFAGCAGVRPSRRRCAFRGAGRCVPTACAPRSGSNRVPTI